MASIVIAGDTSGTVTLSAPAVAGTNTITLPAQTATIATLTTPSFATTIGVGGATAAASGAGITFPASQSASSDANTLDDYEEGNWTPALQINNSTTGITFSTQVGRYTKVGRQVTITFGIALSNKGASVGEVDVISLPFTSIDPGGYGDAAVSIGFIDVTNLAASPVVGLVARGSTKISIRKISSGGAPVISNSDINNTSAFIGTATYFTS